MTVRSASKRCVCVGTSFCVRPGHLASTRCPFYHLHVLWVCLWAGRVWAGLCLPHCPAHYVLLCNKRASRGKRDSLLAAMQATALLSRLICVLCWLHMLVFCVLCWSHMPLTSPASLTWSVCTVQGPITPNICPLGRPPKCAAAAAAQLCCHRMAVAESERPYATQVLLHAFCSLDSPGLLSTPTSSSRGLTHPGRPYRQVASQRCAGPCLSRTRAP